MPIQVVQNNLGHASVGTTSMYLTAERDERLKAMRGFWKPASETSSVTQEAVQKPA